ncbi:MAG: MucB/RseB C-terminal domain-containing protein [Lysobacterales bacterium]
MISLRAAASMLVAGWLSLTAGSLAAAGFAPDSDPARWLERMSTAMSQMSYQGTFVYVQGDEVVTMRITHVVDDVGVRERLVSMSGAQREVLRDPTGVRWVLGDDHSVLQDQAFSSSFFPQLPTDQQDQAGRSYTLKLGGSGRIAGQPVRNLEVLPKDDYRYGYSLWLEEQSALLLKWQLVDRGGSTLAKLMFTDIRMGSQVDPDELNSSSPLKKFKTVESRLPAGRGLAREAPHWRPTRLPPGFELTSHRFFGPKDDGLYEHLVYSDGLAAVSVYVESDAGGAMRDPSLSRLGTTHAFSKSADGVLITVIGEVPAATVRFIGEAVVAASP